jgi:hypothetical protein
MIASDSRHPIFRPFLNPSGPLGDVQVEQHRRLKDEGDRTVLARFSGGDAALTEQTVGKGGSSCSRRIWTTNGAVFR